MKSSHDEKLEHYGRYLTKRGLKSTHQRDVIVHDFFKEHQHLTVEELWARVKKIDPKIGYATVYRTLKLLTEAGLAFKREFGGGQARYEHVTDHHHDHLICTECGKIVEFEDEEIEKLQEAVVKKHRFKLLYHKMELYGRCADCEREGGEGG